MAWTLANLQDAWKSHAFATIFAASSHVDPVQSLNTASGLPLDLRDQVATSVVSSVSHLKPAESLAFVKCVSPGPIQNALLVTMLETLAIKTPSDAAQYSRELLSGNYDIAEATKENLFERIAHSWSGDDSSATANWIGTLQPGNYRDAACLGYIDRMRSRDPGSTARWVETLTDIGIREKATHLLIESWTEQDAAAAQEWLKTTEAISSDLRAVLLRTP